ncbi:ABC transporter permease [Ruicaihuangia caeni]|uniref:ABC transporter permease n=1 Tax=Ruicaihuangia caeni TaxID=3042517 RepID=A0AAW6T734_9MICO|nr:ABC transporter permease [Klugiella sp. YN-L-19]MDI2099635.1 ABC transporter permease [Klugiella sp. YN-L-19]
MTQLSVAAPVRLSIRGNVVRAVYPAVLVGAVILIAWELAVHLFNIQPYLLPAPSAIVAEFGKSFSTIASAAQITTIAVIGGALLGAATGVIAAFIVALFEKFANTVLVLVAILSCAPVVALAPIFNAWFGATSLMSKIAVAAIMVFFPVMVATTKGLLSVHPLHRELMESLSASRFQLMVWVRIPGAVPSLFDGMRVGATLSVIGIIVAEYFGGTANALGVLIANSAALSQFPLTWAAVAAASLLGLVVYGAVMLIERLVAPWRFTPASR